MATRLYLQATGSAAVSPTFDANWEQTGQAVRLPMVAVRDLDAVTALTNSTALTVPITTTQDILAYQFVSNRIYKPVKLDAAVLLSLIIRALESATTANVFLAYALKAFSADGGTSLATLASSFTNTGTEFGTTAATRIFSAIAITAATLSQPWRLVLELGGHVQAPTAGTTYTMRAGSNAATDFALTSALTTDLNPWMELSANLDSLGGLGGNNFSNFLAVRAGSGISVTEKLR